MLRDVACTGTGMVNLLLFPQLKMSLTLYLRRMQKAVIQKVRISICLKNRMTLYRCAESYFCFFADVLKNKNIINDDLGCYGVPFNAVKTFIHTCPMCVPNKVAPKRTKMQPLKMILSKKVGSRFQMDLIEMPPYQEYSCILHVVDHLSKYGYV
jgi:hypothetical protein